MILHPAQKVDALKGDLGGRNELAKITPIADTGAREISSITAVADVAGSLNSTYFTLTAGSTNYYVWFNINSAGVDPAVAGKTGIAVAGATGASAATLATAMRLAIASAITTKGTVGGTGAVVTVTNTLMGNITNVADGTAATGFTFASTAGAASNLQNKYFVIHSAADAGLFHVWMNVNGEGVDPTPANSTGIPVAIAAGASALTIADAIAAAIEANGSFDAEERDGIVFEVASAFGLVTDATDGNSGFSISTTEQGESRRIDSSASPASISNDPTPFEADT